LPEIFTNQPVVITEKLDGGNTCLWNGEVYARSTSQPSRAGWMSMVRKHHAWKRSGMTTHAFYGEDLYGIHSIEYDAIREDQTYRLFAVRDLVKDQFVSWSAVREMAGILSVPTVPVLFEGTFPSAAALTNWFEDHLSEPSVLGPVREGFVIRLAQAYRPSEHSQFVAKYVRANHVQTDEHWTRNWKSCQIIPLK